MADQVSRQALGRVNRVQEGFVEKTEETCLGFMSLCLLTGCRPSSYTLLATVISE